MPLSPCLLSALAQADSAEWPLTSMFLSAALAAVAVVYAIRAHQRVAKMTTQLKELHGVLNARFSGAEVASQAGGASDESVDRQRQSVMFEQHQRLNDLTIAKLEAEIVLIKNQSTERDREQERFEAGKEYHELMVEKTRLEIDSLRLHITEIRQRLDDWKFGS